MNHFLTARRMGLVLLATLLVLIAAACMGSQGPEGPQGSPGPVGPMGPQGAEGQHGQHGAPGQHGTQGVDGAPGQHGAQGADGPPGPQGPEGPEGPAGRDGVDGAIVTTGVSFTVMPLVMKWERSRDEGAWFVGSGLEPGQWFNINIDAGGEAVTVLLFADEQGPALKQANDNGAFALGLPIDSRDGRFLSSFVLDDYTALTVTLSDQDTGEVLATAPWILCDDEETDIPLCATAGDLIPTGRVTRP